ncbi:type II toxin-antitoxin system RelE/ParE family toxin [Endozoicomonas sp. 4G]|uniref:type II toxin-antitoxin system RelE/ParE family toxin n=1 Tax=Endozoicomonas sp. 4G TaxID=2872754 RepID=UPI00211118CD|nr:type II toxin-antitoxin system RelE/ParE family toxin [Endozoicomonas sp. 4G]
MPPNKQYLFKPRAQQDLEDIYDYSASEFGEEQADLYIRNLFDTFQRLAETPGFARYRDDIRKGLKSYPVKAHIVFFRKMENGVLIVRVLHQSMDFQSKKY